MVSLTTEDEVLLVPARFNERLIAYLIDAAPLSAGYLLTLRYAATPRAGLAWLAVYVVYQFLGNLAGATVGKRLMGLRVVRRDGQSLGVIASAARAVGHLLSTPLFNFGFLLALLHPENRALHDLLSGSLVVEPQRKHPAEATLLFVAAAMTLSALYGLILYLNLFRPTPIDLAAVARAREGLGILAQIEEAYKQGHGTYTDGLSELAQASGDAGQFKQAMRELFDPHRFEIQAGNQGYRISARARDRRQTKVTIEGPPPRLR